jgi:hypothetical protein
MVTVTPGLLEITPEQLHPALDGVALGPRHSHVGQADPASVVGKLS